MHFFGIGGSDPLEEAFFEFDVAHGL